METNTTAASVPLRLALRIGRGRTLLEIADYAEASRIYSELRDRSGLGASRMPEGRIYGDGRKVGHLSYNGRVWQGETCVFDPYGVGGRSLA